MEARGSTLRPTHQTKDEHFAQTHHIRTEGWKPPNMCNGSLTHKTVLVPWGPHIPTAEFSPAVCHLALKSLRQGTGQVPQSSHRYCGHCFGKVTILKVPPFTSSSPKPPCPLHTTTTVPALYPCVLTTIVEHHRSVSCDKIPFHFLKDIFFPLRKFLRVQHDQDHHQNNSNEGDGDSRNGLRV